MKKLLSIILALAIVLSFTVPATAENSEPVTPEIDSDIIELIADTGYVKAGDTFTLNAAFVRAINSNVATLTYTFNPGLFEYMDFTPAAGVGIINTDLDLGTVKMIVMKQDYDFKDIGDISLRAKLDAGFVDSFETVSLSVDYVEKNGDAKEVKTAGVFANLDILPHSFTLIDLSNIIDCFGVDANDPEWSSKHSLYDFISDGIIDIIDISFMARLINISDASGDVVRIGVFEPQSGDNGAGGRLETLGMMYANYKTPTVEIGGKTYRVELVHANNQSSNKAAPFAAQKLVSAGCSIVLGSYGSGVSIAASYIFGDAGIPVIGATCTNPTVTEGNSHYFRICFLDPFQGTVLANFAKEKFSATKVYCLAKQGDDYSVGLVHYFMEAFGAENCVSEVFPEGTTDYSLYITNAKASGAQVFFSPVSTEAAYPIINQADAKGLGIPILAGDTWDSNVILNAAEGKSVQVYVTTFYQDGGDPEFDAGLKEWISSSSLAKAYNFDNDEVAAVTVMGYDAYYTALEALKAAGSTDPAAVLSVLPSVTHDGISGAIAFDDIGDAIRDVAYVKQANTTTGQWDFIAKQGIK